jgi:hypothetical protein
MTPRWTQKLTAEVAAEERVEIGLGLMDPLDPYVLAERHGTRVYPLSTRAADQCPESRSRTSRSRTRRAGRRRSSRSARPASSSRTTATCRPTTIEHRARDEPASAGARLGKGLIDEDHSHLHSKTVEKQALFLSGELLAPTIACNKLAFREADNAAVAELFNISTQFAQMQMKGPRQYAKYALKTGEGAKVATASTGKSSEHGI